MKYLYRYDWMQSQNGYLLTFKGQEGGIWADFGKDAIGSTYFVQFNQLKEGTGMRVSFVEQKSNFKQAPAIVTAEDIHIFWQRKLGMRLVYRI